MKVKFPTITKSKHKRMLSCIMKRSLSFNFLNTRMTEKVNIAKRRHHLALIVARFFIRV